MAHPSGVPMSPKGGDAAASHGMRSRWIFFTLFMVAAFQGRFMSVFLEDRGLQSSEIGAVLSVSALVSIFAAPVWTLRADTMTRRDSKEHLLLISIAGSEIFFAAQSAVDLGLIPPHLRFAYLFACRFCSSLFFATWHPLANAIAVQDLLIQYGERGSTHFGKERLWGAVSWAGVHLLSGFLNEHLGTWTMFIGHALSTVCAFGVLLRWTAEKHASPGEERIYMEKGQHPEGTLCCGAVDRGMARLVVRSPVHATFFLLMLCTAAGMSLVENLLFIFFTDYLKAGAVVCGVSVVITVLFEIPLFEFGPDLLQKHGIPSLLCVATLAYIVRVVVYTLVPQGWYVLLIEPLHGVTIALMTVASNEFITVIAPPHRRTSAQGLLASVRTGLGYFIGTLSGGWIMESYGDVVLYRGFAALVAVSLVLYLFAAWQFPAPGPGSPRNDEETPLLRKSPFPGPVVISRRSSRTSQASGGVGGGGDTPVIAEEAGV